MSGKGDNEETVVIEVVTSYFDKFKPSLGKIARTRTRSIRSAQYLWSRWTRLHQADEAGVFLWQETWKQSCRWGKPRSLWVKF